MTWNSVTLTPFSVSRQVCLQLALKPCNMFPVFISESCSVCMSWLSFSQKKKKAQIEKNKRNLAICCAKIAHATAGLLSSWKSQFSIELLYAFYHEDWLWTLASWWDDTILFFPPICLYVFFFKDDSDNSYSLSYC